MTAAKILIAEDEGVVAMHLSRTLSGGGYVVTSVASTAERAIQSAAENRPDLVLMDIGLRGETDGIQAAEVLRERFQVPVVYLTAFTDETTLERAKATEPYGFALKPFNDNELLITIEMALYKHRADQALRKRGEWLDAMLSSVGEAMIATDAKGRVMFINDHAEELTGWPQSEAYSRDITEVLRAPEPEELVPSEHFVKRVLRKHSVISRGPGSLLLARNGNQIPVEDCAAPILDAAGRVSGAVVIFRDASERRKTEARLVHMAHHDSLTGLPNRVLFRKRLHEAMAHARRARELVAVLLLDLDNFKTVNDTLGHAAGDTLLVAAADRICDCVRETDTVARLGGDEIAVIQPDLDDLSGATTLADKLVHAFDRPFLIDDSEVKTTVSIGITIFPTDEEDPEEILRSVDNAMYRAKTAGRNRYDLSSGNRFTENGLRSFPEKELRRAVERSEFEVHFQPIFELESRRVTGAEALIRWNHPKKGLIPASRFIRAAERIGIIASIVDMSLRKACSAATRWLAAAPTMRVSVNLSESDLHRRDLVTAVSSILTDVSLAPEHLELEVTERSSIQPPQSIAAGNLQGLRDLGILISLDRFGRDHASILTMSALPAGTIKIDRSLVKTVPNDPQVQRVVRATVDVSESFKLKVVAVGVETEDQVDWLRTAGCHHGQGNLLGSPIPSKDFFEQYIM